MKKVAKTLLILTIILCILGSLTVLIGAFYLLRYKNCQIDEDLLKISLHSGKTQFYRYDFNNKETSSETAILIDNAYLDNGIQYQYVPLEEIPQNLVNAFIAIEDKRFYSHNGLDYFRTGKATLHYLLGKHQFGGSTITQQLVKNLTGNDEISVDRKLTEAFCALELEKNHDKTEILEMYLNVINLSEGCRGVGAAAEHFYSKKPMDLSLSECATIAAITNNPAYYNPASHPDNNLKRRNSILKCMLDQGMIETESYYSAISEPIKLHKSKSKVHRQINSWYIDMVTEDVISDLCHKYDISKSVASLMLYNGGFHIYTAMDADIQAILDDYYTNQYNFPIDSDGKMAQSSMIVIDPYTGDILGVAGAIGKKTGNRIQNYATTTKRPPGSTIKPISTYAPALEKGLINWATVFEDSPIIKETINQKAWPSNVDHSYVGNVTVQYAVEHSLNTVAVKIMQMLGKEEAFEFLNNKLHIKSLCQNEDFGYAALALGQPSHGITLRELTAAYSIFEEGIMSKSRSYYKVTDSSGNIVLDNASNQEAVISKDNAAIMTKLLETVVDTGTAAGKITLDHSVEVAGKSGTSQGNCDRLFVGYTPELLAGVWFGYDYPKDLSEFGGNVSVYIWDEVMTKICNETSYGKVYKFPIPNTVQKLTYNKENGVVPPDTADSQYFAEGWFSVHIPD